MILALLVACEPSTTGYSGEQMAEFFPLDGHRSAVYTSEDTTVLTQLAMEKVEPTEIVDDRELVTLEYSDEETGDLQFSVQWSAVPGDAVYIHGFALGADALVTFDPPVSITDDDDRMRAGDAVETSTTDSAGASYTFKSTFSAAVPECPTIWTDKWTDCIEMVIEDGGAGLPFSGTYTLVTGYGPAYMLLSGDTANWNLTRYEYVAAD